MGSAPRRLLLACPELHPARSIETAPELLRYTGVLCVPWCAALAARFFGRRPELSDAELLLELCRLGGTVPRGPLEQGTGPGGLASMLAGLSLESETRHGVDHPWLEQQLNKGRLVVVHGRESCNHALLVHGFDLPSWFLVRDVNEETRARMAPEFLAAFIRGHRLGRMVAIGAPPCEDRPRAQARQDDRDGPFDA